MHRFFSSVLLSLFGASALMMPASAQTTGLIPGTITVVGEGSASAPAETAMVLIVLGGDSNVYIDPAAIGPDGVSTPTVIDATSVVNAIVASGIPAENVTVMESSFQGEWGSGMPATPVTISVTVDAPTVAGLSSMLETVRTTAAQNDQFVNQFSVLYSVADCRPLRQQAREAAVANAREQAEDQAMALDTTIGSISASRDTIPQSMGFVPMNGCSSVPVATPFSMKYVAPMFDPAQPAEVTVTAAVELSFDLP